MTDFPQSHLIRQLGLAPQTLADWATRRPDESVQLYSDRLYEARTYQVDLAPLNDIKCAYVEIVNPFLTDRVVKVARGLPDDLRNARRGFTAVASALGPDMPAAKRSAILGSNRLLSSSQAVIDELIAELTSSDAERISERRGLDRVVSGLHKPSTARARRRLRDAVRGVVPRRMRARVNPEPALTLSTFALALRLHIASRMATMLTADASALGDRPGGPAH